MRRKTAQEKDLNGTYRPDKEVGPVGNTNEFPDPQPHLNRRAQEIYFKVCEHLAEHNNFTKIDSVMVSELAYTYEKYQRIVLEMDRRDEEGEPGEFDGTIKTHPTGARQVSDLWIVANKQIEMFMKIAAQLGMSPKSRAQIAAFVKGLDNDKGEELNLS